MDAFHMAQAHLAGAHGFFHAGPSCASGGHPSDRTSEPDADESRNPNDAKPGSIVVDTYTPSAESYATGDNPAAVRGEACENEIRTCYCGSCEGCHVRSAKRREDPVGASRKEELGRDGADEAPREEDLSEEEKREVEELQRTDRDVRAHEQAHVAAGARNATYEYRTGPDGRPYAVGGSAQIEINAPAGDPDEKAAQARKMRAAALAPADPSPKDLEVAAKATRIEMEALDEKSDAEAGKTDEAA